MSQRIWPATTWRMVGTALAALLALADQSLETDTGGRDRGAQPQPRPRSQPQSQSQPLRGFRGLSRASAEPPRSGRTCRRAWSTWGCRRLHWACTSTALCRPAALPMEARALANITVRMATTGAGAGAIAAPQLRRRTCKPWHEQSCSAGKCHARCLSPLAPERGFLKSSHPQRQQLEHVTWKIRRFACALPMCSGLRLPRAEPVLTLAPAAGGADPGQTVAQKWHARVPRIAPRRSRRAATPLRRLRIGEARNPGPEATRTQGFFKVFSPSAAAA